MSEHNQAEWYKRKNDFAPYTRADGKAVADELDSVQASFDLIPQMRTDGKGFAVSPVVPEPREDDHAVPFKLLKEAENSVNQSRQVVEQKASQVDEQAQQVASDSAFVAKSKTKIEQQASTVAENTKRASDYSQSAEEMKNAAASSAKKAIQSEGVAINAANSATNDAEMAKKWASHPRNQVVDNELFSAMHYALLAEYYAGRAKNIADGEVDYNRILNVPEASPQTLGVIKTYSEFDSDSENLSLSAKAGKKLKALLDAIRSSLSNYIPNSKKSDAINSNSSDTIATSYAVKKVNDLLNNSLTKFSREDGFRLIGQAESVEQLRTLHPTEHGQRILVKSYYAGSTTGGGEFVADLQDLVTPDDGGTCFVVAGNGGRWKRVLDSEISAFDFGAVGDGVADDAQALNRAANYCQKQWGKTLFLRGEFNLGSTVSLRHCKVDATRAKFIIGHNGIGLILGGAGNNANNPTQQIDEVIRAVGMSPSTRLTPLVQVIGAKGQYIDINRADYVQIYANATAGSQHNNNYSSAYSTFNFKFVNTIELFGESGGWINENTFNLNRCFRIVLDGDYLHNHNLFNRGCMESQGEIYCNGSSNQFVGFRFERQPSVATETLKITFTESSWNNHIEASWQSSKGYTNNPYGTHLITVNDEGLGNTVNHIAAKNSQDVPLFSLTSQADIAMAGTGTGGVLGLSNMAGVRNLKRLPNGRYEIANNHTVIYESPLIDLTQSPIVWFRSSEPHFRMRVYYFNEQNQRLTNKVEVGEIFSGSLYWNDSEGFSFMQANSQNINFHTKPNQARFAKVIISSGSNVAGLTFNAFALGIRQFNQFSKIDGFRLEMLPEPKGGNQPLIYQNQEIDMDKVPEGVVCYKSDLTEMRVNIQKMPLLMKSIVDKTITLAVPKMFLERGKGELLYKSDTDGSYKRVAVASGYHITITLTDNAPSDLSVNSEAYFVITKTKGL